jgi:hypothetical protein
MMFTRTLDAWSAHIKTRGSLILDILSILVDAPMMVYLAVDLSILVIELSTHITTQWEQTRFLHICPQSLS